MLLKVVKNIKTFVWRYFYGYLGGGEGILVMNIKIQLILQRIFTYPYLPTPPLGQDMIQGQFLSGV